MKAIIENKFILLIKPTQDVKKILHKSLSFVDKSLQFQLNRLKRNPFKRNDGYVRKLEREANQVLYKVVGTDNWVIPSGMYQSIIDLGIPIEDRRKETGKTLPLPWGKKPFELRDYQREAIDEMKGCWRGTINLATGLGKTLIATWLVKETRKNTLIVVPSESIAKQFYSDFCLAFGPKRVAMYGAGKQNTSGITIGIAASVIRNLDKFKELDLGLIIFDEVHHIAANTFYDISKALGDVGRLYGLTATDYRSDGKDIMITAGCGHTIFKRDILWGISHKWLAEPIFTIRKVPTVGRNYKSDKLKNYKEHVLNNDLMKKMIYNDIKTQIANGRTVLCLVAEIEHGLELQKQLGIPFARGKDKKSQDYVDALNAGKINALIGTAGKISEGTDTKKADAIILASFMASKGPVIQSIGRGLRMYGSKVDCLIFDYIPEGSGMLKRHALLRKKYYQEITNNISVI